jgi:hypothetical protein
MGEVKDIVPVTVAVALVDGIAMSKRTILHGSPTAIPGRSGEDVENTGVPSVRL